MRHCKICNSEMKLMVSTKEPYSGNYFWGCSDYPNCKNLVITIIRQIRNDDNRINKSWNFNSLKYINPQDRPSDNERHCAIEQKYNYDHDFTNDEIDSLDINLGFHSKEDFYIWIATQTCIEPRSFHNYVGVGSPYNHTFRNIKEKINRNNENIVDKILNQQSDLLNECVSAWEEIVDKEEDRKLKRAIEGQQKQEAIYLSGLERRIEKATHNIFNAIKRKDYKAIEAMRLNGAKLDHKNENGLTSIEYAKTFNDEHLIVALTKDLSQMNKKGGR